MESGLYAIDIVLLLLFGLYTIFIGLLLIFRFENFRAHLNCIAYTYSVKAHVCDKTHRLTRVLYFSADFSAHKNLYYPDKFIKTKFIIN